LHFEGGAYDRKFEIIATQEESSFVTIEAKPTRISFVGRRITGMIKNAFRPVSTSASLVPLSGDRFGHFAAGGGFTQVRR